MLPGLFYTARSMSAALQTSHSRRRDAAAVTPREAQVWLVLFKRVMILFHTCNHGLTRVPTLPEFFRFILVCVVLVHEAH